MKDSGKTSNGVGCAFTVLAIIIVVIVMAFLDIYYKDYYIEREGIFSRIEQILNNLEQWETMR